MFPVLGHIGNFEIRSYYALNALGIAAGLLLLLYTTRQSGAEKRAKIFLMAGLIFIPFILGGFLGGLLDNFISKNPSCEGKNCFYASFSLWWGLITATLSSFAIGKLIHADPREISDYFAVSIAGGGVFARIACLLNGCCIGKPAPDDFPFAVFYPFGTYGYAAFNGAPLHPAPLYESMAWLCILLILLLRFKKRAFKGELIVMLGFFYGLARFFIEFFRYHETSGLFSTAQFISVFIMAASVLVYIIWKRKWI